MKPIVHTGIITRFAPKFVAPSSCKSLARWRSTRTIESPPSTTIFQSHDVSRQVKMFSTEQMTKKTSSTGKFFRERHPKITQLLDSARLHIPDHEYLKTISQELFPLLQDQKIKLSIRQYWLVFRIVAQHKAFWLVDSLLSYYHRDFGTPTPLIYERLFELYGKTDLNKLLGLLEEAKQNNIPFTIEIHTTFLKGLAARGSESLVKNYFNQIKQAGYQLDVLVYSVYVEGIAKYCPFAEVLEVLKEMQQQNITPNAIVLNGILSKIIYHDKNGILNTFLQLIQIIPPNIRSFEIILKHSAVIQSSKMFDAVWDMVTEYKFTHTDTMYNSRIHLHAKNGDIPEMNKAFTEMQAAGLVPNRLTYAFLIEGYIKKEETNSVLMLLGKIGQPSSQSIRNIVRYLNKKGNPEQAEKVASLAAHRNQSKQRFSDITQEQILSEDKELMEDLGSTQEESGETEVVKKQ